jgi:hypothetical protein
LNPHLHVVATDGVYVLDDSGTPVFHALPAPTQGEVAAVAWSVCEQTVALLRKQGRWTDADPSEDNFAQCEPLLASLYAASLTGTLAMGPNAGKRPMRLFGAAAREHDSHDDPAPRNGYGFDLHAGVRVPAHDRAHLGRLCRYLVRPPLGNDRLQRLDDGRYSIRLKTAWKDGTSHVVLSGVELVARLAALIPPPRVHSVRYFGVFAPHAKLRALVVPKPKPEDHVCAHAAGQPNSLASNSSRMSWATLMKRAWDLDVLECPRCHARLQHIAVLTDAGVIAKIAAAIARKTGPS